MLDPDPWGAAQTGGGSRAGIAPPPQNVGWGGLAQDSSWGGPQEGWSAPARGYGQVCAGGTLLILLTVIEPRVSKPLIGAYLISHVHTLYQ